MSTRIITGVALAGTLVLASCMQDQSNVPIAPTGPSLGKAPSTTCSFSTMNTDARAYFANSKDPVFALIDAMQTAYKTSAAAATPPGYQVLSRIGVAANTGATLVKGDSVQGSTLANDVLRCMEVAGYSPTAGIDLAQALGTKGLFAVRSDAILDAVTSRFIITGKGPLFGAEREYSASWYARRDGAAYSGAFLFYGYPLTPNAKFNGEDTASVAFELSTLPTLLTFEKPTGVSPNITYQPALQPGVCDMASTSARMLHKHATTEILPQQGVPGFCSLTSAPLVQRDGSPGAWFASSAKRVVNLFAPTTLYAFGVGGGSALVSDLSPLGAVTFQDTVYFAGTIPNSKVSQTTNQFTPAIAVYVKTKAGNPIVGALVTLDVSGNSGSFTEPTDVTRYTDSTGLATFPDFYLDKAGGYTITATSEFGTSALSNLFNVSGQ